MASKHFENTLPRYPILEEYLNVTKNFSKTNTESAESHKQKASLTNACPLVRE